MNDTNSTPAGFTRHPAVRSFIAALFTAAMSMTIAGGIDVMPFDKAPYLFVVILVFAFIGGLFQERMAKNF